MGQSAEPSLLQSSRRKAFDDLRNQSFDVGKHIEQFIPDFPRLLGALIEQTVAIIEFLRQRAGKAVGTDEISMP